MTGDGLATERVPGLEGGFSTSLPVSMILGLCDHVLGEIGRRSHLFAWLRPPGSGTGDWLVIDSYYPGNRLVVVCREEPAAHDHLYAELVPAHGLRLLQLTPADLGGDRSHAEPALRRLIAELGPVPPRPTEPPLHQEGAARDSMMARVSASFAQATTPPVTERRPVGPAQTAAVQRATRLVAARKALPARVPVPPASTRARLPRRPPRPSRADSAHLRAGDTARPGVHGRPDAGPATPTVGLVVGLALSAVLCAEVYVGVARLALDGDHWLLAFGIALDACSRALGTIAAERTGRQDRAWWCLLGGSPAVARFALFEPEGPVATDPAPLAGLLSVLSTLVIAFALLAAALKI
jgi:hypothetical protein